MSNKYQNIVVSVPENSIPWINHVTFKLKELQDKIILLFPYREQIKVLFESGVPCEILAPNQPWKKGRLLIKIELILDEPEESIDSKTQVQSPLDEIRSQIQP